MIILADTNQKPGYHPEEDTLMEHGHDLVRLKLPVGDYCVMTDRFMDMFNNRRHEVYTDNTFLMVVKKYVRNHRMPSEHTPFLLM